MGKKVNGVTLLKCRGCGKELSGKRKAFCSRICSTIERKEKERIRYRIYNPQLEKRNCLNCNKKYQPTRENQGCCCRECRRVYGLFLQKENYKKRKQEKYWQKKFISTLPNLETPTREPSSFTSSPHQDAINNFISKGGKIKVLPDQLDGRTPSVGGINSIKICKLFPGDNVDIAGHWEPSTLLGFGYEIDIMDDDEYLH